MTNEVCKHCEDCRARIAPRSTSSEISLALAQPTMKRKQVKDFYEFPPSLASKKSLCNQLIRISERSFIIDYKNEAFQVIEKSASKVISFMYGKTKMTNYGNDYHTETTVSSFVLEELEGHDSGQSGSRPMSKARLIFFNQSQIVHRKEKSIKEIDQQKASFADNFVRPGAVQEEINVPMKNISLEYEKKQDAEKILFKPKRTTSADRSRSRNRPGQKPTMGLDITEEENLRKAFMIFDQDGDGRITKEELRRAIKSMGYKTNDEEIKMMFDKADINQNGTVEFDEFIHVMMISGLPTCRDKSGGLQNELHAMFDIFDLNKDGRITAHELNHVMKSLGENLSKRELEDMMRTADSNGDGIIDFQEFESLFRIYDESLNGPNVNAYAVATR